MILGTTKQPKIVAPMAQATPSKATSTGPEVSNIRSPVKQCLEYCTLLESRHMYRERKCWSQVNPALAEHLTCDNSCCRFRRY